MLSLFKIYFLGVQTYYFLQWFTGKTSLSVKTDVLWVNMFAGSLFPGNKPDSMQMMSGEERRECNSLIGVTHPGLQRAVLHHEHSTYILHEFRRRNSCQTMLLTLFLTASECKVSIYVCKSKFKMNIDLKTGHACFPPITNSQTAGLLWRKYTGSLSQWEFKQLVFFLETRLWMVML